jgi:phage shock protein A
LKGVGWFEEKLNNTHECPVCAAVHTEGNPRLAELKTLAHELKSLSASVHQAPAKLDQELAVLRQELRGLEGAISKVRQKRKFLENSSNALAAQRQRVRQIYLFVGRVEQALENVSASRNVDKLREEVKALSDKIAELKKHLDPLKQRDRINAAVDKVSAKLAEYARLLKLEHATENVRLNIRELTLQFKPLSGRTDFLWEVGSGQNWVGYHIAGLLALHEHFISLNQNPVPRFLVVDQPSQVYFPEAWPTMEKAPDGPNKTDSSPDIDGVRRIFSALSNFLDAVAGQFQIIVTEHAGSITWDGISNVHLVGNWRHGHDEFLVPAAWIVSKEGV